MRRIFFIFLFVLIGITVFAQYDKATPRDGEGVQAFLIRNKRSTAHYSQFLELNKGKFGKSNSLLKGVSYLLPPLSKESPSPAPVADKPISESVNGAKRKNILFGRKYENYTVKSNKLKGAMFFLSSGHGGPDPGATGQVDVHKLHEDEYAYDITLRLARRLLEEGAMVYIIIQDAKDGIRDERYLANSNRETCMGQPIPLNQAKRLKQRADKINSLNRQAKEKYKRSVFIHLDSRSQKKQLDVFFYHAQKSTSGKKLANTMRDTFRSQYQKHQPNRGFTGTVSPRNLYMLEKTNPVGIFAELGNIQNTFDQRRFLEYDNRQALANWMCMGFIKDYESWKKGK